MAPKKPPAPAKPAAAAAPPPAPEHAGMTPQRLKMIWMCIGGTVLVFGTIAAVMGYLYSNMLAEPPHHLEPSLNRLRSSMAASYRRPKLNYGNAIKVSDFALTLMDTLKSNQHEYAEQKKNYQNLYKKDTKARSAGTWGAFGRNLYYVSKGRKTWYDAENFCVSRDSHLASVLSDEEQNYITSQLKDPAWIGFTDEKEEGKWEWTDGSRVTKQYWHEENTYFTENKRRLEKDCTSIVPSLAGNNWHDTYCHELRNWVCKESVEI
uniref:CD209 antigen-like protein C n=1 Tax=Podarcis muralis TaxID=64176 RepID=UPI0010A01540|nr:CD209 antigen-like protein C [Podarcis muralis]XP_028600728.1 CD209 antigen-like protein C [Podarcis muralis]XP_028600729.1 CD209 antigen-like protein C [Podarcis muralis]